jgi:hypothetical protein
MADSHPLMALLLDQNSFVGASEMVEEEIMPLDEQLNFGVGDVAIAATANTMLERDFVIVRMLDAEKYTKTFPDWEERLLNSFVLCKYFSRNDPEDSIGWFSRLKLLPITSYRYREARTWLKKGFPNEIPDWAYEVFQAFADRLSVNAPEVIPKAVTCPECGGRHVGLKVVRRVTYEGRAGVLVIDGKEHYVPLNDPEEDSSHTAKLFCKDCRAEATLSDGEWQLPGISN